MFLYTLIALFSITTLFFIFNFFNKKNIELKYFKFSFYFAFSFITIFLFLMKNHNLNNFELIFILISINLLIYSALDDLISGYLNILLPIASFIIFFIILRNPIDLLISFCLCLIIYIISHLSKENLIGKGDSFFFLPIFIIFDFYYIVGSLFLTLITLGSYNLMILFFNNIKNNVSEISKEMPLTPFILLSFSIVNYNNSNIVLIIVYSIFALSFLLFLISIVIKKRPKLN